MSREQDLTWAPHHLHEVSLFSCTTFMYFWSCNELLCLLLARLESIYSLNEWVQRIWGLFWQLYDNQVTNQLICSSVMLFFKMISFCATLLQNDAITQKRLMVCFHCPTPMPIHIPIPVQILCRKAPLGTIPMFILMQSYYENYLKNRLFSTNISVKLGTVPICIRTGIGIGSVETVLHIIILAIWIGIKIGIGVGQWKHTIRSVWSVVCILLFILFNVSNTSEKFEIPYNISGEEERAHYEQDHIWLEEGEGRLEWTEWKHAERIQVSKVRISKINFYSLLAVNRKYLLVIEE